MAQVLTELDKLFGLGSATNGERLAEAAASLQSSPQHDVKVRDSAHPVDNYDVYALTKAVTARVAAARRLRLGFRGDRPCA